MRLAELIPTDAPGSDAVEIAALAYDSHRVAPGTLFFCVPGEHSDGHDFAARAVAAGAAALVVERTLNAGVPEVVVPSTRASMGPTAARFYCDPSTGLRVVGVTGTNGKTTTAYLVRELLQAGGEHCGLLGTVTSVIAGAERPVSRTTPEALEVQGSLREMLDGGDAACAMEVSSHALELGRVDGVHFAAAIFTNLTQDHLDFHADMEEYFQAKRRLFVGAEQPKVCVVNIDDPYGLRLAEELPGAVGFAIDRKADYSAHDLRMGFARCDFRLRTPVGERAVKLPLAGRFNVANALGALAAAHTMGGDLDTLVGALERGVRVPGRFEPVQEGQPFAVLVDYAHTPDSLENVLAAARELASGRVICVFGAGGDRDRGKRPLMGDAAARGADAVFVTSDNPRSESPEAIVAEIVAGIADPASETSGTLVTRAESLDGVSGAGTLGPARVEVEVDRRAAIERAIGVAEAGDVVVIAGKGHEQGQEFADGRKVPFDDVSVAREALRARGATVAGAAA